MQTDQALSATECLSYRLNALFNGFNDSWDSMGFSQMGRAGVHRPIYPILSALERPRLFAYGKHDLHLGPASRPPDRTWGHGTPWVCTKRVVHRAYKLKVCVLLQTACDQDASLVDRCVEP
eukprot:scaffold8763_cov36-Phaeocystis_antarctica.AAC.2